MPILFDADPETGMRTYFDYDPIKDEVHLSYEQDVTHFLDRMNEIRKNPGIWSQGVKEDWALYCSIPPVVEMELKNRGLDLHNKDHMKDILKVINAEYPYLRATDKWHR